MVNDMHMVITSSGEVVRGLGRLVYRITCLDDTVLVGVWREDREGIALTKSSISNLISDGVAPGLIIFLYCIVKAKYFCRAIWSTLTCDLFFWRRLSFLLVFFFYVSV